MAQDRCTTIVDIGIFLSSATKAMLNVCALHSAFVFESIYLPQLEKAEKSIATIPSERKSETKAESDFYEPL